MYRMVEDKYVRIYNKVKHHLEQERVYLDSNLSLATLSRLIGTNTVYLSKAINQGFGCGFKEVVNGYRIEYLMTIAPATKNYNLEEIAKQCGFGSRSTFYEAFRQRMGMTPRKYMEIIKNKDE